MSLNYFGALRLTAFISYLWLISRWGEMARVLGVAAKLLATNPSARRALLSVCTAGGMGVTAIVESAHG